MNGTMQKRTVLPLLAFLMLAVTSCNQTMQDLPLASDSDRNTEATGSENYQRNSSEAIEIAQDFANKSWLRSSPAGKDIEVDYILNDESLRATLAEEGVETVDTILYIVNRAGDNGFTVIAGDKRIQDILIASDSGNLSHNEEIGDDSGFAVFLSRLPLFYASEIEGMEKQYNRRGGDHKYRSGNNSDSPAPYIPEPKIEYSEWKTIASVGPLVPVQWDQNAPYNNETPLIDGQRALAGCVAIAAAQFTAYYNYPSYYNGMSLDWNLLTKHKKYWQYEGSDRTQFEEQVSKYVREIGNTLKNSWGVESTGAWTNDIVSMLQSMGYSNPSSLSDYNQDALISSLAHLHPAIMEGYSEKYTYKKGWWIFKKTHTGYRGGHSWLVDGYISQERTRIEVDRETNQTISRSKETRLLVHCNWGWGGYRDGYFYPGVFDSNNPIALRSKIVEGDKPYYYQHKVRHIANAFR